MVSQRKPPLTLALCQPGDVVYLPKLGRVLVTGNNMGTRGTYRLVRRLDDSDIVGEPIPVPTNTFIVSVERLYYARQLTN